MKTPLLTMMAGVLMASLSCEKIRPPEGKSVVPISEVKEPIQKNQSSLSPSEKEFNNRLNDFIKEGRSIARMLDLVPELIPYNKRIDVLTEMHTRIPNAENDRQMAYKKFSQSILTTLELASFYIKSRRDFLQAGAQDKAVECDRNCKQVGEDVRYYFDELDSAINNSRLPLSGDELDKNRKNSVEPTIKGKEPTVRINPSSSPSSKEVSNGSNPVSDLKLILVKMEEHGTTERVVDFLADGYWQKRKHKAASIKYDVRKTDSLVSPYVASVSWDVVGRLTKAFPTKEGAEKAEFAPPTILSERWNATFAYQDGKWVVTDVWWRSELVKLESRHSKLDNFKDPIQDWWLALGGNDIAKEPAKKLTSEDIMGEWLKTVKGGTPDKMTLNPSGRITHGEAKEESKSTWTFDGTRLIMRHPDGKVQGGFWIDTAIVSEKDGKISFEGANQFGATFKVEEINPKSIAGVWQERDDIQVTIVQNGKDFTANCSYQDKEHGEIRWRMTGTISKDHRIIGRLVYIKAPKTFKAQALAGTLSKEGNSISGRAVFDGGGHDFVWRLLPKSTAKDK